MASTEELAARERELAHLREHPRLDAAPERAAAHQQVVELERVGRLVRAAARAHERLRDGGAVTGRFRTGQVPGMSDESNGLNLGESR